MKKNVISLVIIMVITACITDPKDITFKNEISYSLISDIFNTLLIGFIAFKTLQTTNRYNNWIIKPILSASTKYFQGTYLWELNNSSKHPATNILIRHKVSNGKENGTTEWVSCSTLPGDNQVLLFWIFHADSIEICYSDMTGNKYYKAIIKNLMVKTSKIKKKEYDEYIANAQNNKVNNIVNLKERFFTNEPGPEFKSYVRQLKRLDLLADSFFPTIINFNAENGQNNSPTTANPNEQNEVS